MKVVLLDQTGFSLSDVYELVQDVYKDRTAQGIDFTVSKQSFEDYCEKISKEHKIIFVIPNGDRLVGSAALSLKTDKKGRRYGGFSNAVVRKDFQGQGLGSKLFNARKQKCIDCGCDYIASTTAENAESSIRWHFKNGWYLYGYGKNLDSKYYSYAFRQSLKSKTGKLTILGYKFHFWRTFIVTRLMTRRDGGYSVLGKFIMNLKSLFSR